MSDLDDFHKYRSNPEVTKYQGFEVMNREEARRFIEENSRKEYGLPGQWVQYGIERAETGRVIGDCAIHLQQHESRVAEIGITISHLEQQKGYAKEALLGILRFLFTAKNIHRVTATTDAENTAAAALFESAAFRREGHFIENIFFKGKWGSEFQYAFLRCEWEAGRRE